MPKRPWQAITCLIQPDRNEVKSKSFVDYREALAYGIEWLQTMGMDDSRRPTQMAFWQASV